MSPAEEDVPYVCPECHAVAEACAPWCSEDRFNQRAEFDDDDGHSYDCACAWCTDDEFEP